MNQPSRRPNPARRPSARVGRKPLPKCTIEVVDPDDVLILNLNDRWHRSFTSSTDRYPLMIDVPPQFLNQGWNMIEGTYTNVAIAGHRNDASVEYKILLDGKAVVHVTYRTEVQPQTFTLVFKDTFNLEAREIDSGRRSGRVAGGSGGRFDDFMQWSDEEGAPKE